MQDQCNPCTASLLFGGISLQRGLHLWINPRVFTLVVEVAEKICCVIGQPLTAFLQAADAVVAVAEGGQQVVDLSALAGELAALPRDLAEVEPCPET